MGGGIGKRRAREMRLKNKLKGELERIEEDLKWEKMRVCWQLEKKAYEERARGNIVKMGRYCVWIDGGNWE